MRLGALSLVLYIGIQTFAVGSLDKTHPFSVHDMLAMERLSDPQVSPDGKWITFALKKIELEANLGRTDLWLTRTDGTDLRRLTSHPEADSNPRWAPDSKTIFFLSSRSGSSQVWRIRIEGGEGEQITRQSLDVGNLIISPDEKHIAFTMEVFPDCNAACTKEKLDAVKQKKTSGLLSGTGTPTRMGGARIYLLCPLRAARR